MPRSTDSPASETEEGRTTRSTEIFQVDITHGQGEVIIE